MVTDEQPPEQPKPKRSWRRKKPRKRGYLSLAAILNAFRTKRLHCDIETGTIYSYYRRISGQPKTHPNGTPLKPGDLFPLRTYPAGRKGEYICVRLHLNNRRRNIMVHRVVWMVANNRIIRPTKLHIDHIDGNTTHNCHRNLRLLNHHQNMKARDEQYERDRQEF